MTKPKKSERFYKQISTYRYRHKRSGRYVSKFTKNGTVRKNVIREKMLTLLTADAKTGLIRKYGSIREPSRRTLEELETKGRNVYLKGVFRRSAIWDKAVDKGATGVLITIKAKGRRKKDTAIMTRVIFDKEERKNSEYMQRVVLAKVMRALADRELRLSDLQITSHKKSFQLKNVRVKVDYYREGEQWRGKSSSATKKKSGRKGKRKRRK